MKERMAPLGPGARAAALFPPSRAAGAALALAAVVVACGGSLERRWVAQVDGTRILFGELSRAVSERLEDYPGLRREQALDEELYRLVSEQVVLNRADELGVKIHDAEVRRRLSGIHGADFNGADPGYFEEVRQQMIRERTALLDLAGLLSLPDDALLRHFEEHRHLYRRPEQIQIRQIVVENESLARNLRSELVDGADFPALAADHSLAPESGAGGLLPPFARGELPEVFDRAFSLSARGLSQVIESPYGFHIFKLESRIPQHEPEFSELREDITLELQQRRLEELRRDWLRGLRREAEIKLNEPLLEELR